MRSGLHQGLGVKRPANGTLLSQMDAFWDYLVPLVDSPGVDLERVIAALAPATVVNPAPFETRELAYDSRAVIPGTPVLLRPR